MVISGPLKELQEDFSSYAQLINRILKHMGVRTFLISPATNKNQILDRLYNAQDHK